MLPQKYQSQSTSLANYDYVDIADQTGISGFYGTTAILSGSTSYMLIGSVYYAASGSTILPGTATTTINFDSPLFNVPRTVQGKGYASISLENGAGSNNLFMNIKLQKWDGTTATDISAEYTTANLAAEKSNVYFVPLTCTQTHIKVGEQVRLKVDVCTNGAVNPRIFHDPMNSLIPAGIRTTILKIGVPFRIDI